jgi:hypothetical protein
MSEKDLIGPKGLVFLEMRGSWEMTSYLNSNFGRNLNRVPSLFLFQTLLYLILCNLFLVVVERGMMV